MRRAIATAYVLIWIATSSFGDAMLNKEGRHAPWFLVTVAGGAWPVYLPLLMWSAAHTPTKGLTP